MLSVRRVPAGPQTELLAGAGLRGFSAQLQAGGRFSSSVAPGSYTLKAGQGWGRGAPPPGPRQWAAVDINVGGDDLVVPLVLQPGIPVNGRVVFEGETPPTAAELQSLSFMLKSARCRRRNTPHSVAPVRSTQKAASHLPASSPTCIASRLPGTHPAARDKWTIKSAAANGREADQAPLRVNANEPVEWTDHVH